MPRIALVIVVTLAAAFTSISEQSHAAWTSARGNSDNTGFANVDTAPATDANVLALVDVGIVAPGANPVAAPDGTIHIGNLTGELIAMRPDDVRKWIVKLTGWHGAFHAAPVVGGDGSVYAVSSQRVRDHRTGVTTIHEYSFLHKVDPAGNFVFSKPFPMHFEDVPDYTNSGATTAPPNILRQDGTEFIIVPVKVSIPGGFAIHLVAFDTAGDIVVDQRINHRVYDVSGGSPIFDAIGDFFSGMYDMFASCLPSGCRFSLQLGQDPYEASPIPMPGVAIWNNPRGFPIVWMADNIRNTFAFEFDAAAGFKEIFRFSDPKDRRSTPPLALENFVSAVGTAEGKLKFERGSGAHSGYGSIAAPLTRVAGGKLAVVFGRYGGVALVGETNTLHALNNLGFTNRAAAASCTHVYVATNTELATLNPADLSIVHKKVWVNDSLYPPMIGPLGHVYSLTSAGLYIFGPPTERRTGDGTINGQTYCSLPPIEATPAPVDITPFPGPRPSR